MIYSLPSTPFASTYNLGVTGLVGTVGVELVDEAKGTAVISRQTSGIAETPASSGVYTASLSAPGSQGEYLIQWDEGSGDPDFTDYLIVSTEPQPVIVESGPLYTTPDNLRDELSLTGAQLTDNQAFDLIESAEDVIDQALGHRSVDPSTGRKVDLQDPDVAPWQLAKLERATTKLAAQFYRQPDLLKDEQRYTSISGPEFSFSGLIGSRFDRTAVQALNASGLRKLGGRAVTRHRRELDDWRLHE